MKYFLIAFLLILSMSSFAQTEKTKQQWLVEAQAAAQKAFAKYHTICNSRVVVRTGDSSFYEFSAAKADVAVLGLYNLLEADKLNGKLWSGKIDVDMGKASRKILIEQDGSRTVSEWKYGRAAEFNFVFEGGKWKIVEDKIYSPDWYLEPSVKCSDAGF